MLDLIEGQTRTAAHWKQPVFGQTYMPRVAGRRVAAQSPLVEGQDIGECLPDRSDLWILVRIPLLREYGLLWWKVVPCKASLYPFATVGLDGDNWISSSKAVVETDVVNTVGSRS